MALPETPSTAERGHPVSLLKSVLCSDALFIDTTAIGRIMHGSTETTNAPVVQSDDWYQLKS